MSAVQEQPTIGRPRKFQSVEELQAGITAYFDTEAAAGRPFTMAGLARALDCSTSTLRNYENERAPQFIGSQGFIDAVKKARQRVEEWTEARLYAKGHPAGPIFSLKNNFGWKDVQEVEHTHTLIAIGQPGAVPAQLQPPAIEGELIQVDPTPTFAQDASLSPVPRNSKPVDK